MKETKHVVTENFYFDNRDESISITFFGRLWINRISNLGWKSMFFQSYPMGVGFLSEALLEEVKTVVTEIYEIEYRHQSTKKYFEFWEFPDFDGKNQLIDIWIESFSPSVMLLIVIPMKEIKPVVTKNHHFDNGDESFSITIFGKFWTLGVLKSGSISRVFQLNPALHEWGFQLRF